MGLELVLIIANLMNNEQIRTALYLDRPAAQMQIQQAAYIEKKADDTKAILKAIEGLKN